jgi:glycine cleavage system H protein
MKYIPNESQNLVSGKAGALDLQSTKQAMCEHMVDGGGCKDEDAGAARNQIFRCVRYTESHEWITLDEGIGTVGITDHAQRELGEIVYVELPALGKKVKAGEEIAVLESTKAAADIYAPVSGEIVAINQILSDSTQAINQSAENQGWLFKIQLSDASEWETLLDAAQYQEKIQ